MRVADPHYAEAAADDPPVGLTVAIELLTGRSVAAAGDDREQAEWPLHPGRLYMAFVAAYFETDGLPAQRAALEWLAGLAPPEVHASDAKDRVSVQVFVPVNDKNRVQSAALQSAPGIPRGRQDRYFPTKVPLNPTVAYVWTKADPSEAEAHLPALRDLAAEVIRVGHSSSLVSARATWGPVAAAGPAVEVWRPDGGATRHTFRIPAPHDLQRLENAYGEAEVERFAELKDTIDSTRGKTQTQAKAAFEEAFGVPYRASLTARVPAPARVGRSAGYRVDQEGGSAVTHRSVFSSDLYVLSPQDGPRFGLGDTLALTRALRSAAMKASPQQPPPAWLSGHAEDRSPSRDPHLAFLPLPFVGGRHGDGHLLGLAIAVPRHLAVAEVGEKLGPLLADTDTGELRTIRLKLGRRGDWDLHLEERSTPPLALTGRTWTDPCTVWGSVSPVVLDRFPKTDRRKNRAGWAKEIQSILRRSCVHAGLPEPVAVDFGTTAWHLGAPRASRKLRAKPRDGGNAGPLGEAFPPLPAKPGRPPRLQVHVYLAFDRPVAGPVLLGAGRFAGYGLCKPLPHHARLA